MLGLFKKKDNAVSEPPLPDILPPLAQGRPGEGILPPLPQASQSTHDMIPNDIELGAEMTELPPLEDFTPESLPSADNGQTVQDTVEMPSQELYNMTIPQNVEAKPLPELPPLPQISEPPRPGFDDEVPSPPAIFSDDHFYETPEEVKHMVEERDVGMKDYVKKYNLDDTEAEDDERPVSREALKREIQARPRGPIFVDVDAFRTMMSDIDDIKVKLKTTTDIMQHLTEIKSSKDKELERWRQNLEDMQRKINYVDRVIFKGAR